LIATISTTASAFRNSRMQATQQLKWSRLSQDKYLTFEGHASFPTSLHQTTHLQVLLYNNLPHIISNSSLSTTMKFSTALATIPAFWAYGTSVCAAPVLLGGNAIVM
jgi:hypothetical protein